MKGNNIPKTVICFDFDNTIISGHLHNSLASQGVEAIITDMHETTNEMILLNGKPLSEGCVLNEKYDPEVEKEHALKFENHKGVKGGDFLKNAFQALLKQGHNIVNVSYGVYTVGINAILENECGFTAEQLGDVISVCGFPEGNRDGKNPHGKNKHLEIVMKVLGITDKSNVLLIDDSVNNVSKARAFGVRSILVQSWPCKEGEKPQYLDACLSLASKMMEEAKAKLEKQSSDLENLNNVVSSTCCPMKLHSSTSSLGSKANSEDEEELSSGSSREVSSLYFRNRLSSSSSIDSTSLKRSQ